MIKSRVDQLHRDCQTAEHGGDRRMRLNVRTEFVAAKERVAAEERVAFPLEIEILRQPLYFVAMLFHPFRKERLLAGAFFVTEIAGNEFTPNSKAGIRGENHVGKAALRRYQMNVGIQV